MCIRDRSLVAWRAISARARRALWSSAIPAFLLVEGCHDPLGVRVREHLCDHDPVVDELGVHATATRPFERPGFDPLTDQHPRLAAGADFLDRLPLLAVPGHLEPHAPRDVLEKPGPAWATVEVLGAWLGAIERDDVGVDQAFGRQRQQAPDPRGLLTARQRRQVQDLALLGVRLVAADLLLG